MALTQVALRQLQPICTQPCAKWIFLDKEHKIRGTFATPSWTVPAWAPSRGNLVKTNTQFGITNEYAPKSCEIANPKL